MTASVTITRHEIEERAQDAAALLRALAHPQRLRLVCELIDAERGVGELEELTGIRQPALSKELGKLREAGIIEGRRVSKAVFYSLVDQRAGSILAALCGKAALPQTPRAETPAKGERGSVFARIIRLN